MMIENEFTSYRLNGALTVIKNGITVATLFTTNTTFLSEFKAINKYKDLVWDIQGAFNNSVTANDTDITANITLYGIINDKEKIIRQQIFGKVYDFIFEGENVDGDLITEYICFKNAENEKDALTLAEKEAIDILKYVNGGHIDIFDINGKFLVDVEV